MARIEERLWNCPVVHHDADTGQILDATADDTAEQPDGYSIERVLISKEGCWSNCDVFLSAPESWRDNAVELRIYSLGPAGRALLANVFCDSADLQDNGNGTVSGIVLSARGAAGDGFLVVARTTTTVASASIQLRMWGTESMPVGMGNAAAQGLPDRRVPSVASHNLAWFQDETVAEWRPLELDASGALIVTGAGGGGSLTVRGDQTPSDAYANPTTAIASWSLLGGWNGATWQRARITGAGSLLVGASGFSTPSDALPNPTAAIDSLTYSAAYNRAAGTWGRVDRGDNTSTAPIALANAGFGLRNQSFLWGALSGGGSDWRPVNVQTNGALVVNLSGDQNYADNANLLGAAYELTGGPLMHRNQDGSWYLTRGGYVELIAAAALPAIVNDLPAAVYRGADPSPAAGDAVVNSCSVRGGLHVTQLPTSPEDTFELPIRSTNYNDLEVPLSGGNVPAVVQALTALNSSGSRAFIQIHNKASAPVATDVPIWSFPVDNNAAIAFGPEAFTPQGLACSNGAWVVWSTVADQLTVPASATGLHSIPRWTA